MAENFMRIPKKALVTTKTLLRRDIANYLLENRKRDAQRFIDQVQAEQTQKDIGNYIKHMKTK